MKIGILTFHDVFNPGAFLQALGSQTLVRGLGHEALVLDYTSPAHRFRASSYLTRWGWRMLYRMNAWVQMILKDRAFERARKRLLNRTQFYESREQLSQEHFDAVLVGADVVWNFKHAYLGRDPVYFGEGLQTDRLISFAASFGDCSLEDGLPSYVREGLPRFDHYSVRDQNTAAIVREVVKEEPLQICDPAFHLDLSEIMPPSSQRAPFLLVYLRNGAFSPELKESVVSFAKKKGLKIVATYYTHRWADENLVSLQPQDWVGLMRDAAYVVTNTFHGSVFSIMLEKKFALDYNDGIRLKTKGMIEAMGLTGRTITNADQLESVLETSIDYSDARSFRERETLKARQFLEQALSA